MYKIMTPGPTMVRDNVRSARSLRTTNPDIDTDFVEFYKHTCDMIAEIINSSGEVYILGGEGILGLEAACASLTEQGDRVLVIDKHAAHERIIYEKLKAESGERTPQLLLLPVTVTLSKEEYAAVIENLDLINESGFEAEDFGNGCVIIRECPMELSADDIEEVITEIAGRFVDKKQDVMFEKLDWIYHSVACRSAIKAGNFTSRLEMERFAKQLLSMPDIRYCPHGRPVLIEMTKRELEKNFGRI